MAVDAVARAIAAGKVPVDAYQMAVAGGYTGTKEQFEQDMGNSGTNAINAADSAAAAAASATTAANAAGNLAPAYSASATYAVGDHVLYDGGYYVCTTAITTAEAWTAAHWTAAKVGPEITDLKTQINGSMYGVDGITDFFIPKALLINSSGNWSTSVARHISIPVKGGDAISLTGNSDYAGTYAALKSDNAASGAAADFCANSGDDVWQERKTLEIDTTVNFVAPSDCNVLYLTIHGSVTTAIAIPVSIKVNGVEYNYNIRKAIDSVKADKADKNSPAFTGSPTAPTADNSVDNTQLATTEFVKNVALNISQYADTLANGTNVDNLLSPGTYRVLTKSAAQSMTGTPPTAEVGYKLVVVETTRTERIYQIAFPNSYYIPILYRYYTGTEWREWNTININFNSYNGSKNLLPKKAHTATVNGVSTNYEDGVLTLNGTANASAGRTTHLTDTFVLKAGTYTLSETYVNNRAFNIYIEDIDDNVIANSKNILSPATFTLSAAKECYIGINVTNGNIYDNVSVKLQIEQNDVQTYFVAPSYQTAVDKEARMPISGILSAFTNIECAGDSLTYGAVYTNNSNYRQAYKTYPDVMGHITGATITAVATAGYNASEWWTAYGNQISAKTNALAIIYLGTNGGLTDTMDVDVVGDDPTNWSDTHTGNYAKIINAYQTAGYKVLLVKCFATSGDLDATNSVIKQMADRFKCGLVDNEYMANISYHYTPDRSYANTLHYNDLGYSALAHLISDNADNMSETYKSYIIPN